MKRIWTIIGVRDVAASFTWYQALFGQAATTPAHDHFGQIVDTDGTVLLCLHQWGAHEHPSLMSSEHAPPGNGLLLFFRVDDYYAALPRARKLVSKLEEEPHVNPNTQTMEFSLRDPDGYYVTISPFEQEAGPQSIFRSIFPGSATFAAAALIPAALLFPFALWFSKHGSIAIDVITRDYMLGIAILWLPTLFLIDFVFWTPIRRRAAKKLSRQDNGEQAPLP